MRQKLILEAQTEVQGQGVVLEEPEGRMKRRDWSGLSRILGDRRSPITTPSGLQYEVLLEGTGSRPGPTSKVKVHYVGTLGGIVSDSSRETGKPATFPLNQVIKGWTEGMQLMKEGAIYRFEIPPDLAYGKRGAF